MAFVHFNPIWGNSSLSAADWKWLFYDVFTIFEAYRWDASFKSSLLIILNEIAPRGFAPIQFICFVLSIYLWLFEWFGFPFIFVCSSRNLQSFCWRKDSQNNLQRQLCEFKGNAVGETDELAIFNSNGLKLMDMKLLF